MCLAGDVLYILATELLFSLVDAQSMKLYMSFWFTYKYFIATETQTLRAARGSLYEILDR